jgi:hypothetical protein
MFKLSKDTERAVDSASRAMVGIAVVSCVSLVVALVALAVAVSAHD